MTDVTTQVRDTAPPPTEPLVTDARAELAREKGKGTAGPGPRRRRLSPGKLFPYGRLVGPLLLIGIWAAGTGLGLLDTRILSAPWTVVRTAGDLISDGRLQNNLLVSLQRAGLGLGLGVVVGTALAIAAGLSRVGEATIDGAMQVKRAIPSLALLPLLILWLGIGEGMKVITVALGVMVQVYINTYASLTSIDKRYVELAESLGLSRAQFIRKVVVPGALPGFFVGLRLAVTASWLGLIVVEQVNATAGIGYMMFQAQQYAQTDIILVGLLVYGIFGFASDALVRAVERRVLSWRRTLAG
ncbi:ABC transporter permease [Streptomyces sp. NPDC051322]|uniref:ABC transporter permease n=1 Tax=Streptomyces sp. NPDC051322 TaxID=3154645 RepID=UPI00344CC34B